MKNLRSFSEFHLNDYSFANAILFRFFYSTTLKSYIEFAYFYLFLLEFTCKYLSINITNTHAYYLHDRINYSYIHSLS